MEARLRQHDGVFRWFLMRVEPLRDETARLLGGTEQERTSRSSNERKRSCEKTNASFAGLPTRSRRRSLFWTRLALRYTQIRRILTIEKRSRGPSEAGEKVVVLLRASQHSWCNKARNASIATKRKNRL
jgi:hypothetical protein